MTYNGWANYPTWAVALWVDNDPGSYEESRLVVRAAYFPEEGNVSDVADALKEFVGDMIGDDGTTSLACGSLAGDLLQFALDSVNWHELATHWIDELEEEEVDA